MPLGAGFRPAAQAEAGRLDAAANPYAVGRVNEAKDQYMQGGGAATRFGELTHS